MLNATRYVPGQWNTVCPRCGFRFKSGDLVREWTGLHVCNRCYDPKHPQMDLRVRAERGGVPWTYYDTVPPDTRQLSGTSVVRQFEAASLTFVGQNLTASGA